MNEKQIFTIIIICALFGVFMIFVYMLDSHTLSGIKSKTVGDGQHGTARWAAKQEIKKTFVFLPFEPELWRQGENLPEIQGTIVGCRSHGKHTTALVDTGDVHTLMIGAAGVGKTAYFLYPNIEFACASGMSFLSTDTKGDVARNYGTIAKDHYGYNVSVLDLRNPTRSDAVSWIGDGIASAWNNTVVTTLNDITDAVFDAMFQWTYGLIFGAIAEIFVFINNTSADIFNLAWVQAFIALFYRIGWMLFLCGLIVAVFDAAVAYESGQNTVKNTFLNVLKGFFAVNLITVVPQRLYSFCTTLQGSFAHDLISSFVGASPGNIIEAALYVIKKLDGTQALSSLIFIILFGYCTVKVVLANIKRGGILLCQIAVGSLYMFSVPRGYTDGFYNWVKQVIATCLTAFLQTTILFLGLLTYDAHPLLALGICMSANEVPRVAQMFGLDTSTHVNMVSVSSTVSMGTRAIKLLAKH